MKKIFFLLSIIALASCNVIKEDDRFIEMDIPEASERTVLLMDFTGWKCVNCPDAAKTASQITEMYPENCIVVSMHPKGMTFTEPGADGPDFATDQAMEYLKAFGGSVATSLPQGIVDMTQYKGEYLNTYDRWAGAVIDRMADTARFSLNVSATDVSYSVDVTCTEGEPSGDERLLVWLVEDSIVGRQLTKSGEESEYMHRHVFRRCLNGSDIWGDAVLFDMSGSATLADDIKLDPLQGEHYIVVAVLIDGDNHVLQAAEAVIGSEGPVKNPGFFTIKDVNNEVEYHNGDTIHTTHFNEASGEMMFEGYVNIDSQSDVDFYVDEERDFDASTYFVSLCILNLCRADMDNGHWGPFEMTKDKAYDFQSHLFIPEEERSITRSFTTRFTFSNGNPLATISIVVVYDYEATE